MNLAATVTSIVVGVAITLVAQYLWQFVAPRSNLVYWHSHGFTFTVPDLNNPLTSFLVHTRAITVQNTGKRPATKVEIAHTHSPDVIEIWPRFQHRIDTTKAHIIEVASLGPRELVTVESLTIGQKAVPTVMYVRSHEGTARLIPIQVQRVFPSWFNFVAAVLLLIGTGFTAYWLILAVMFVSAHIFK